MSKKPSYYLKPYNILTDYLMTKSNNDYTY